MSDYLTDPKGFTKRLALARKRAGFSQNALSAAGVSGAYVHLIERGRRVPSLQVINQLAKKLGVSTHWLLTGEEDELCLVARELVEQVYGGIEPEGNLVDRLDELSMPAWYADWLVWLDQGSPGERPEGIPARIPKWVRDHQESRAMAAERRNIFK